jgi:ATP-dependent protease ClpP protease subunit
MPNPYADAELAPGFNVKPAPTVPPDVYAVFVGLIDNAAVQRLMNGINTAQGTGHTHVHLLFHSPGGVPPDGIALYNFFRALTIDLTLYNVGSVASAAVTAYLGAKNRNTSKYGSFMIHKTYTNPVQATAEKLKATSQSLQLDDARTEGILKERAKLTAEQWEVHRNGDLWLSADEALAVGIATQIAEFAPPAGYRIFTV